ncbi:MAG: DUF2236 domain-containing protein, partial [Abitibacteriaceae bacterium]|nr:DUF2236 domain-containing protein [Abditibacteriaceae bacterium]
CQALPEAARAPLTEYLTKSLELPPDLDEEKLQQGETFFAEHGPTIVLLLMCKSMPECYAAKNASEVLAGTGLMSKCLKRRMVETGQFLIDAMSPGGLRPDGHGRGLYSAQKVRLMHAAIRYHVIHHTGYQDYATSGTPINQEDMIATLLSFSHLIIEGIAQLGIPCTAQEAEGYLYACNLMGYMLGVREELLPRSVAEARVAWQDITKREYEASQAGQELTAAMVDLLEATTPGTEFKPLPIRLMRYLAGDKVSDLVKVPPDGKSWRLLTKIATRLWLFIVRDLARKKKKYPLFKIVYGHFSLHLLNTLERTGLDGKPATFTIPDECRLQWGMAANAPVTSPPATPPAA